MIIILHYVRLLDAPRPQGRQVGGETACDGGGIRDKVGR
jgi:hypothetical protein